MVAGFASLAEVQDLGFKGMSRPYWATVVPLIRSMDIFSHHQMYEHLYELLGPNLRSIARFVRPNQQPSTKKELDVM